MTGRYEAWMNHMRMDMGMDMPMSMMRGFEYAAGLPCNVACS